MARGKIAVKIKKLETELKYWHDELAAFDRVETSIRRLNASSNSGDSVLELESEPDQITVPPASNSGLRRTLDVFESRFVPRGDLRRRVLDAVKSAPGKVASKEVERSLLKEGYKPKGKHFDISVYKTLNRLAEDNKIDRKKYAGHVWFQKKPPLKIEATA